MQSSLTPSQESLLQFLVERAKGGQSPPTCREICTRFGYRSPKAAVDHLHALERKGFIARDPKRARGIRVVNRSGRQLPLLGEIVAGYPLEVEVKKGNYSGLHPQALGLSDWSKTFALRVRGDSMTGRGIFDGDIVLLEHGAVPRHEDVVAALIDNESTLKTFVSKGAAAWLRAENPRYPDLIPAWGLQVQGVARAVVRLLNR